jgi:hypothetical protein
MTRYAHLSAFQPKIAPGVAVKAGTPIGQIGSTGSSTGAHLHFEVRDADDHPLNPEFFLNRSFAEAKDLPLAEAQRVSGQVRIAYVSNIPWMRRAAMEARLESLAPLAPAPQPRSTTSAARTSGPAGGGDRQPFAYAMNSGIDAGSGEKNPYAYAMDSGLGDDPASANGNGGSARSGAVRPHARFAIRN